MTWEKDLLLSIKAQKYQDKIYHQLFPIQNIIRFTRPDDQILDVKFHIDVMLKLTNGTMLLGQEKALRQKFSWFNTFTIEFYQDAKKKIPGEFFNLGAQFYFHGYLDADEPDKISGFVKWYIIKIFDFIAYLKTFPIQQLESHTKSTSGSKASFFYINYNDIPEQFIYQSDRQQKTKHFATK